MFPFPADAVPESPQIVEAPSLLGPLEAHDTYDGRRRPPAHLPIQPVPTASEYTRDPSRSLYDVFA